MKSDIKSADAVDNFLGQLGEALRLLPQINRILLQSQIMALVTSKIESLSNNAKKA